MKYIYKIIVAVVVVGVIAFTGVFLLNQYNSGKIGNKAEDMAEKFQDVIEGTWTGTYKISKLSFDENNTITLTLLGADINGEYKVNYDLNTESYSIAVKYTTVLGLSVDLKFLAELDEETLVLTENSISSIEMRYTRYDGSTVTQTEPTVTQPVLTENNSTTQSQKLSRNNEKIKSSVMGNWISQKNSASGYNFAEDGTVKVSLLGLSYDGNYSFSVDDNDKLIVTIVYASVAGLQAKNSFYVDIDSNIMTLSEVANTSVKLYYTRGS